MKKYSAIVFCLLAFALRPSFAGECAPFYCNMDSNEAIEDSNGAMSCEPVFVEGVDGNGMQCGPTCEVTFYGADFNSSSGSVSVWFRKNSADVKGGIWEIGQIGAFNSIGLFYTDYNDVRFEMENNSGHYEQVVASDVLSQDEFAQIVCTWEDREGTWYMKLFVNGRFIDYETNWEPFDLDSEFLRIGVAGLDPDWYGHCEGVIDEVRFYDWPLSDAEVYLEYIYTSGRYEREPGWKPVSGGPVKLENGVLMVDGKPFLIKGVGYQPVPIGMDIWPDAPEYMYSDPCIIARDVNGDGESQGYLPKMNANTVRLWMTLPDSGKALLNALEEEGMYAIMGFYVNSSGDEPGIDYSDPCIIERYTEDMNEYVNRFKDHPAVLMWAIGNENNLHYDGNLADWYKLANQLARVAYEVEGPNYHPTMVVNGSAMDFGSTDCNSDDANLNYVDIWGHNAYTYYDYHSYFCYYDKISAKPLVITEYGTDARDKVNNREYEDVQAQWDVHEWEQIRENCLGGTIMAYSDEFWKSGDPCSHDYGGYFADTHPDRFSNEEWYGIMAIEDDGNKPDIMHPREVYCALLQAFGGAMLPADFDFDCDVDFNDLALFTEQWLFPKLSADVAPQPHDRTVNFLDWAIFANAWQSTPSQPNGDPNCDVFPDGGDDKIDWFDIAVFTEQWTQFYYSDIFPSEGDGVIDLRDFAILAESWLLEL